MSWTIFIEFGVDATFKSRVRVADWDPRLEPIHNPLALESAPNKANPAHPVIMAAHQEVVEVRMARFQVWAGPWPETGLSTVKTPPLTVTQGYRMNQLGGTGGCSDRE